MSKGQIEVNDIAKVPQTTKQLVVINNNIDFNEITETPAPAPSIIQEILSVPPNNSGLKKLSKIEAIFINNETEMMQHKE